jgi:DNA topoisomerase-1
VAKRLGNTTAVCRKCYVHPAVIDAYLSGSLAESLRQRDEGGTNELDPEEAAVLAFLRRGLKSESGRA